MPRSKKKKRPAWAKKLRYKAVRYRDNVACSSTNPSYRLTECYRIRPGRLLRYPLRTIVCSPNGVCKKVIHECCNGIHACRRLRDALAYSPIVLRVYAKAWYGRGRAQRAQRIYVASLVSRLRWK